MPDQSARHNLGETCPTCTVVHLTGSGRNACVGHVTTDRDSYVKGQPRKLLDQPRACRRDPVRGLSVCPTHGGKAQQAEAAGQQRTAEAKARAAVEKRLGAAGESVTDPIATLCAIAGRAVEFMEGMSAEIDRDGASDRLAEIRVYAQSIKDAGQVVESIVRLGIAERFAKDNAERTAAVVAFFDAVLTDLGHNPRDPEVAGVIARRLELVS